MGATITFKNLTIGYRSKHQLRAIASSICASLQADELTCLIGANGVGKSTLLRTLAGFQPALEGEILLSVKQAASSSSDVSKDYSSDVLEDSSSHLSSKTSGKSLSAFSAQELARIIGVVLTSKPDVAQLTVKEVVGIGRSPYTNFWGTLSSSDHQIVDDAIRQVGIPHLASRYIHELSDGERQKVMIAKALAQQTSIIILDEPTAFLDFPSKVETLQMLRRLAHEQHKSILLSTHDVELALQLSDRLWLMEENHLSIGTPRELAADGSLSRFINRDGIRFNEQKMRIEFETFHNSFPNPPAHPH